MPYIYELNIVQNLSLHKKAAKASEFVSRFKRIWKVTSQR